MVVAGVDNRLLSEQELAEACALLDEELENGALGVGSALIYPPGSYADSGELRAFSQVLARHDAVHICHLRSEGQRFLESIEELVDIARTTGARGEIYHLKVAGKSHWHKMSEALQLVESAREDGVRITADVYPYEAGNTLLSAALPPEFRCRDTTAGRTHLNSTGVREQIRERIHREDEDWENLYAASGGADGVTILSEVPALGIRAGEALGSIARRMGHHDPVDTILAVLDALPTAEAAYFIASEDNTRTAFERPWVSVGSDADAQSTETLFAGQPVHPRSFGTFARILSRYTRGIGGQSVEECVRRMTSLPAENFGLAKRGYIAPGGYADLAIFDPSQVEDLATYDNPRVYATGMRHVVSMGNRHCRTGCDGDACRARTSALAQRVRCSEVTSWHRGQLRIGEAATAGNDPSAATSPDHVRALRISPGFAERSWPPKPPQPSRRPGLRTRPCTRTGPPSIPSRGG